MTDREMKPPRRLFGALIALSSLMFMAPYAMAAQTDANQASNSPMLNAGVVTSPSPTRTIGLSTCFDKADQNNREIISGRWNVRIAQAGIKIASAIPNPQFNAQLGFGPAFTQLFTGQTQQIGWFQQFQTAGKRTKKIELARANAELVELQLETLRFSVHNRIRRAYAELAAAEAYEALIESQRAVGVKLVAIAQKRFDAGKAAKSEVLQANLNVLQFDTQRNQAQGRLQQATAALSLLLGERPEQIEVIDVDDNGLFKLSAEKTEIVPAPTRSLPPLEQVLPAAYESRPDWKAAQQQIFVNRKAVALAQSQRVPDLYVGSGYVFTTFSRSQPAVLASNPPQQSGVFLNVTVEEPIFYQHQGQIRQAIATWRQSERQLDLLQAQITTDVITSYNSVSIARANIFQFQNELIPTAADVARIARRGYEVGATSLADAIVAQQQYQQTLSSYFDSVVAYQNAWSDLEKAVGAPLQR